MQEVMILRKKLPGLMMLQLLNTGAQVQDWTFRQVLTLFWTFQFPLFSMLHMYIQLHNILYVSTSFQVSQYEKELQEIKDLSREECVTYLRRYVIGTTHFGQSVYMFFTGVICLFCRRSSCFSRGASIYRGVTRLPRCFVLFCLFKLWRVTFSSL